MVEDAKAFTSITEAVSRPDSMKQPPLPSKGSGPVPPVMSATMQPATTAPSPSANTPALGTGAFPAGNVVISPTANTLSKRVRPSLSILMNGSSPAMDDAASGNTWGRDGQQEVEFGLAILEFQAAGFHRYCLA